VCEGGTCWRSFRLKRDRQRRIRVSIRDNKDRETGTGRISMSVDEATVCGFGIGFILGVFEKE
jgi:hypothetical protein